MLLYHVTKAENVPSILKNGIIPKRGKYANEMGETSTSIWFFQCLEDADEMAPIWLEPFYGTDLVFLEVELPDDYPLEYTGSDYEVCISSVIPPKYIRVLEK